MALGGNVPQGGGLSSSAALEVSVATALNHMNNLGVGQKDLATNSQKFSTQSVYAENIPGHGLMRICVRRLCAKRQNTGSGSTAASWISSSARLASRGQRS
jgi:hypothetical protein